MTALTWSLLWCYYIDNDPTTSQTLSLEKKVILYSPNCPSSPSVYLYLFWFTFLYHGWAEMYTVFQMRSGQVLTKLHWYFSFKEHRYTNKEVAPSLCIWVPVFPSFCSTALLPQHQLLMCFCCSFCWHFQLRSPHLVTEILVNCSSSVWLHLALWQDAR